MSFTPSDFRSALGLFPTGVAIVSARAPDGQLIGMTVSSFNSVSLNPPLVLFSMARTAASYETWRAVEKFGISVLARSQDDLSSRFARTKSEKWSLVRPVFGEFDVPLIPGALASFECERYAIYDGGDHEIFVGRVLSIRAVAAGTAEPLVFFGGRYCGVGHQSAVPAETDWVLVHGW
ncbi:MAG: flavin reductase family protein [Alphaproteobacteria bacterium]